MKLYNCIQPNIITPSGIVVYTEVIDIGVWNMDALTAIWVDVGITEDKFLGGVAIIIPDAGVGYSNLERTNAGGDTDPWGGIAYFSGTDLLLVRKTGGGYDGVGYSGGGNRGRLTYHYTD